MIFINVEKASQLKISKILKVKSPSRGLFGYRNADPGPLAGVQPVDERPHCGGGVIAIAPATCRNSHAQRPSVLQVSHFHSLPGLRGPCQAKRQGEAQRGALKLQGQAVKIELEVSPVHIEALRERDGGVGTRTEITCIGLDLGVTAIVADPIWVRTVIMGASLADDLLHDPAALTHVDLNDQCIVSARCCHTYWNA